MQEKRRVPHSERRANWDDRFSNPRSVNPSRVYGDPYEINDDDDDEHPIQDASAKCRLKYVLHKTIKNYHIFNNYLCNFVRSSV